MPSHTPSSSSRPTLVAAVLVSVAVLIGSLVMSRSLDRVTAQLAETSGKLQAIQLAVVEAKGALAAARPPEPRRGPDPNRRYTVNLAGAPALGPENAPVTVVEFSDFQCPFCARVGPTMKQLREAYPDKVRIVFKHLPLDFHQKAVPAALAAEAAARQGKFWEMHDKIFSDQKDMAPEKYAVWAKELGLDVAKFERDRASAEVKARVDADKKEAAQLGATGTPSFYINGKYTSGAQPLEAFKSLVDAELGTKQGG
jgi:protein-disulfide isomerase